MVKNMGKERIELKERGLLMTRLLIRLFVPAAEKSDHPRAREQYGRLAGWVGVATNLVLFLIKLLVGMVFHSIAVMADAFNNLTDSASSLVTLLGFHMSAKPADAEHPYGHARIEYITGMIVSFLVVMVGFQLAQTSVGKIRNPEPTEFGMALLIALAVSVLLKLWQSAFYKKISRAIDSTALLASSQDSRNDVVSTIAVLLGLLISHQTGWQLDGWLGLGVAVFILIGGFRLVAETANPLLGLAPSKEMVDEIYRKILSYPGIIGLHDLNIHNYGPERCFASVHCEMGAEHNIVESHEIIDRIERDFLSENSIHLVIHLDPVVTDDARANRLKIYVEERLRGISDEITMHDFQVVWKPQGSHVLFDVVIPYRFTWTDDRLKEYLTEEIRLIEPGCQPVITVDHDDSPPARER